MSQHHQVSLAEFTTLRTGGVADTVIECHTEAELLDAVRSSIAGGAEPLLVGGGSNVVIGDGPITSPVIVIRTRGITVDTTDCAGAWVTAAAGESWDALVERAVAEGWVGIESLSGIPGNVGATPIQNVGAYGQEVAATIARVRAYDRHHDQLTTMAAADCGFGYRWSRFKAEPGRYVVLEVAFQLPLGTLSTPIRYAELARSLDCEVGGRAPLAQVRDVVLGLRASKGMLLDSDDHDTWSVGSFFLNPVLDAGAEVPAGAVTFDQPDGRVKVSAAWLIAAAGFERGFSLPGSGAAISTKHTLAFTNRGSASTDEVLALARAVQTGVRERFDIELEPEPTLVGCAL